MPDVLVVIPVYNRPRLVRECLDAVGAQADPAAEVVVVDDGSTDGTAEAVHAWIREHAAAPRFRLIEAPHRGTATTRNAGFRAAGAHRYVSFLDSDDLWPADFLARTCAVLDRDADAVAATADIRTLDTRRPERLRSMRQLETATLHELFAGAGVGSATVFRAEAVRRAGGWDERIPTGEDAALFLRMAQLGRWRHVAGAPAIKRQGFHGADQCAHMYQERPDHKRVWAEIYDEFTRSRGLGAPFPRLVARRWRHAGRSMRMLGRAGEARECLRRGLAWHPRSPRLWWEMAKTYLPGAAR